jgi:hypothetical protein
MSGRTFERLMSDSIGWRIFIWKATITTFLRIKKVALIPADGENCE